MYWRDLDFIAPRQRVPVRTRRNERFGPPHHVDEVEVTQPLREDEPEAVKIPVQSPKQANLPEDTRPAHKQEQNWQDVAQRLQADMDNFRKRQERRAEEAIAGERERLFGLFLPVLDNLNRALDHANEQAETLHQGVELTQRELLRRLEAEGVVPFEAIGQPFDPAWHEAIATTPVEGVEPGLVVEQVETGYILGNKLLRPAKVVVSA